MIMRRIIASNNLRGGDSYRGVAALRSTCISPEIAPCPVTGHEPQATGTQKAKELDCARRNGIRDRF